MKNLKKSLAFVFAFVIVFCMSSNAFAATANSRITNQWTVFVVPNGSIYTTVGSYCSSNLSQGYTISSTYIKFFDSKHFVKADKLNNAEFKIEAYATPSVNVYYGNTKKVNRVMYKGDSSEILISPSWVWEYKTSKGDLKYTGTGSYSVRSSSCYSVNGVDKYKTNRINFTV